MKKYSIGDLLFSRHDMYVYPTPPANPLVGEMIHTDEPVIFLRFRPAMWGQEERVTEVLTVRGTIIMIHTRSLCQL